MSVAQRESSQVPSTRCAHAPARDRKAVNGIGFDPITRADLLAYIKTFLECGETHVVHFFPAHPTVIARTDHSYRDIGNRGDLNVADGTSVVLALRLLGARTQRIPGSDGLELLCRWGVERNLRHYFYGGAPEVLELLTARLEKTNAGIQIAGAESPPFRPLTDADLGAAAGRMRATRADLVWVGLGTPNQDLVAERLRALQPARVILCVGAAFDFLGGSKRRAPRWMRVIGMEWLYRLCQEPTRLWRRYLIGNPRFVAGVAKDFLARRRK